MRDRRTEHAFPHFHYHSTGGIELKGGLTRLEYFSAFAMLGHFVLNERQIPSEDAAEKWAEGSLVMAKAMLKVLDKDTAEQEDGS